MCVYVCEAKDIRKRGGVQLLFIFRSDLVYIFLYMARNFFFSNGLFGADI